MIMANPPQPQRNPSLGSHVAAPSMSPSPPPHARSTAATLGGTQPRHQAAGVCFPHSLCKGIFSRAGPSLSPNHPCVVPGQDLSSQRAAMNTKHAKHCLQRAAKSRGRRAVPAPQQHAEALPRLPHAGAALLTAPSRGQSSGTSNRAARLAGSTRRTHPKPGWEGKGAPSPPLLSPGFSEGICGGAFACGAVAHCRRSAARADTDEIIPQKPRLCSTKQIPRTPPRTLPPLQ